MVIATENTQGFESFKWVVRRQASWRRGLCDPTWKSCRGKSAKPNGATDQTLLMEGFSREDLRASSMGRTQILKDHGMDDSGHRNK